MNIAEKMRELIPLLHKGLNGVEMPDVRPECEDEWSADYAIVQDVYWDDDDFHYFDEPQFRYDLGQFVRNHFGERAIIIQGTKLKDPEQLDYEQVVVRMAMQSQEIEVYRLKPTSAPST